MKKLQVCATLFYIAAALFYVAAIVHFGKSNQTAGGIWLALGSTFLCLGTAANRTKKGKDDEEKK